MRQRIVLLVVVCFLSGPSLLRVLLETSIARKRAYDDRPSATPQHQETIRRRECDLPLPPSVVSANFYPKQFFEEGYGKPYLAFYENMVKNDFQNAVQHPRFITIDNSANESTNSTCKSIYYHIHKCGGITVDTEMNRSSLGTRRYYSRDEGQIGKRRFKEQARSIFIDAYKQQIDDVPSKPYLPVFTFVRDPLVRFLSGLEQSIVLQTGHRTPLNACFTRERETVPMVECVVQLIHDHQSYLNVHLLPQAYEMYKAIYGNDLAFQLINIQHLDSTLASLGVETPIGKDYARKKQSQFNLTSIDVLTPELKTKICQLYKMDVIMLRESGIMEHTACGDDLIR